ncbi:hypothetical protein O3M35_003229 [Rhynocoris fuscipes]|uniref:G2/mitotic-specific cyclin-B3 n=1 Tax=Rhynocoris fuscipes TaxID=488301 RepID=A0AAW1CIB6_9HEMI
MQHNKILVYDENIETLKSKKISNDVISKSKQNRRPLGDICTNLTTNNNDILEKKSEKQNQENSNEIKLKTSPILEQGLTVQSSNSSTDECLKKALDLAKRDYDITLKEKLYGLTEYVDDVYEYLRNLECQNLIGSKHLNGTEMTERMRSILVDWMIDVHSHFRLGQETLELSVYILDRYTEIKRNLNKRNAQLLGLVCIFLAAKYEETEPLEVCDIVFVSDSAVLQKDVLRAERSILRSIDYNFSRPLPVHFVRRYSKIGDVTPIEHSYAMYFCDIALLEYSLVSVRPSMIAAAALFLALCVSKDVIDVKIWNDNFKNNTKYELKDFYHILPRIATTVEHSSKSKLEAVKKKYATPERYYVSMMPGVQPDLKGTVIKHFCQ